MSKRTKILGKYCANDNHNYYNNSSKKTYIANAQHCILAYINAQKRSNRQANKIKSKESNYSVFCATSNHSPEKSKSEITQNKEKRMRRYKIENLCFKEHTDEEVANQPQRIVHPMRALNPASLICISSGIQSKVILSSFKLNPLSIFIFPFFF